MKAEQSPLHCLYLVLLALAMFADGVHVLMTGQPMWLESELFKRRFDLWLFEIMGVELYAGICFLSGILVTYLLIKCGDHEQSGEPKAQ